MHYIDIDVFEAACLCVRDGTFYVGTAVYPAQRSEHFIVKTLRAYRQTIHTSLSISSRVTALNGARICLHRNFSVRRNFKSLLNAADKFTNVFR